jgi:hypothetical protein
MRSASGRTGATVNDPHDAQQEHAALRFFRSRGFAVSSPVGGQFSISAPQAIFEATFGQRITVREGKGGTARAGTGTGQLELNLRQLPPDLQQSIHVVTFSEPPDFGPSSF